MNDALRRTFRPEFLNRLDDTIVFEPLTSEQVRLIVELMLRDVKARLSDHGVSIALTDAAKDWLTDSGFDHTYGARPLRRAIQQHIENPLSRGIIAGEYIQGDAVQVDAGEEGLLFSKAAMTRDEAA